MILRAPQAGDLAALSRLHGTAFPRAWSPAELADLIARDGAQALIDAGVDAVKVAVMKAGGSVTGSVVASDAFFPFRDGLDAVAAAGATAVVQPGGSLRDAEVIAAADEHGLAMVFTGRRHFRH